MVCIYDTDRICSIIPKLLISLLISHHSSCVTCSVFGAGFDSVSACTSLVIVVPSSKFAISVLARYPYQ